MNTLIIITICIIAIIAVIKLSIGEKPQNKRISESDICDNWEQNNHSGPQNFVKKYRNS